MQPAATMLEVSIRTQGELTNLLKRDLKPQKRLINATGIVFFYRNFKVNFETNWNFIVSNLTNFKLTLDSKLF